MRKKAKRTITRKAVVQIGLKRGIVMSHGGPNVDVCVIRGDYAHIDTVTRGKLKAVGRAKNIPNRCRHAYNIHKKYGDR